MIDSPKSLGDPNHRLQRKTQIHAPHVKELTAFVEQIRHERNCAEFIPNFDPADGGIEAECLFVLEAPGPMAVKSEFISRNNPDETAKNWFELNEEAGIPRRRTISWNIIPWYIGIPDHILPARQKDIAEGWPYLCELIEKLPRLRIIVLVGRKAQRVESRLRIFRPSLKVYLCPHPSPMFLNRKPENRELLLTALKQVASELMG